MDWGTSAALMGMAGMLGIRAKLFAAQPEQLVYEDFDRSAILHAKPLLGSSGDGRMAEQSIAVGRQVQVFWHHHIAGHWRQ